MRRIWYSAAASLDGYIAGPDGAFDWIEVDPDIDFGAHMARFDTFLMGRKSYEATRGMGTGGPSGRVLVFSRTLRPEDHPGVTIVSDGIEARLDELREAPGKDINLFGGGALFESLLALGQVDVVEVAVLPILLGSGVPLLAPSRQRTPLILKEHRVLPKTGTVLLQYETPR